MSGTPKCVDGIHQIIRCHVAYAHAQGANICLQIACDCGKITPFSIEPQLAQHIGGGIERFAYDVQKEVP